MNYKLTVDFNCGQQDYCFIDAQTKLTLRPRQQVEKLSVLLVENVGNNMYARIGASHFQTYFRKYKQNFARFFVNILNRSVMEQIYGQIFGFGQNNLL